MATATSKDPFSALQGKPVTSLYVVDGDERVWVDEAVRMLKAAAVPKHAADFNYEVLNAKQVSAARIVDSANMLPAFAERRMVLVVHADKLLQADDVEVLLAYAQKPSPTTTLVIVADKKFDGRMKGYLALKKAGTVLRFDTLKPREMPGAVRARARTLGVQLEEGAVRALVDAVGTDLSRASQVLEVLSLYLEPSEVRAITADDVAEVAMVTREENVFELVDDIGAKDRARVLAGLHQMLVVSREPALRLLALVARHYRMLLKAHEADQARVPRQQLPAALGVPPFVVDKVLRQARGYDRADLVRGLRWVAATDRALKGGSLSPIRAMERLALGLMSG